MTFSIVGADRAGGIGVAVASKFLAVGGIVPYLQGGVGAVATQSYVNPRFGPQGLALLAQGLPPEEVAARLIAEDGGAAQRQFGLVSAPGESATHTGNACHAWAGGVSGPGFAVQGNILTGPDVVEAMHRAWDEGEALPLPRRLLAALQAGDRAGGDRRGRQSAALRVVAPGRGYAGLDDNWVDLRADDHPDPCAELARLLDLHDLFAGRPERTEPLEKAELAWLRSLLLRQGHASELPGGAWDAQTEAAAWALYGTENLEERWVPGGRFDPVALAYLRERFGEE